MVNDVPAPKNLMTALPIATPKQAETIQRILRGNMCLAETLVDLAKHWKIHVWFSEPVEIYITPRWLPWKTEPDGRRSRSRTSGLITVSDHTFARFARGPSSIVYANSEQATHGYPCEWMLDKIVKYEPVLDTDKSYEAKAKRDQFASIDEFRKQFDMQFVTEAEIQKLWSKPSSQTGKPYRRSDFHKIGPRGREVMQRFLKRFKGVTTTDPTGYRQEYDKSKNLYITDYYDSYRHTGRDIKISHMLGNDYVWYSSEYHGCGNGRYGIVANAHTFLWLEDD